LPPAGAPGVSFTGRFWYNLGNGPRAFYKIDPDRKDFIVEEMTRFLQSIQTEKISS
jgi:hypothetical protein